MGACRAATEWSFWETKKFLMIGVIVAGKSTMICAGAIDLRCRVRVKATSQRAILQLVSSVGGPDAKMLLSAEKPQEGPHRAGYASSEIR